MIVKTLLRTRAASVVRATFALSSRRLTPRTFALRAEFWSCAVSRSRSTERSWLSSEATSCLRWLPFVPVRPCTCADDGQERCDEGDAHQILPERMTPHSSQSPSTPERKNPIAETTCRPSTCGPDVGEDPDQARADQPAGDDERDHEPVERDVELVHELVEPLVHEADLDLAVAQLLEHVVHLVRVLARRSPASSSASRRARESMRCGV